jgi:hypothetical protein
MKTTLILAILLMSLSLLAAETFLPEKLHCTSESKRLEFQEFKVTKINSGKPFITENLLWKKTEFQRADLIFTYIEDQQEVTFTFAKQDMYLLKIGQVSKIPGLITDEEFADIISCTELK